MELALSNSLYSANSVVGFRIKVCYKTRLVVCVSNIVTSCPKELTMPIQQPLSGRFLWNLKCTKLNKCLGCVSMGANGGGKAEGSVHCRISTKLFSGNVLRPCKCVQAVSSIVLLGVTAYMAGCLVTWIFLHCCYAAAKQVTVSSSTEVRTEIKFQG